jgi:hypothetical protein
VPKDPARTLSLKSASTWEIIANKPKRYAASRSPSISLLKILKIFLTLTIPVVKFLAINVYFF